MRQEFKPLIAIGTRVRKSPFFEATKRRGVKSFTIYDHMFMPTGYSTQEEEYGSLINDVTIWDVSCERYVESGKWEIEIAGERCGASASIRPLYDPQLKRVRG